MMKLISLFLLLLLPVFDSPSQTYENTLRDELSWNEFYKLRWDDFQGEPGDDSQGDAGAAVQIRAKPFIIRKEINYDVVAIFNRSKSWARDTSASLLAHEQLHFDIAELYARKIRKRVADLQADGVTNIKTYNSAIQKLLLESNEADARYDIETLHGVLSKKQQAWRKSVGNELLALKKYKKTKRVIRP